MLKRHPRAQRRGSAIGLLNTEDDQVQAVNQRKYGGGVIGMGSYMEKIRHGVETVQHTMEEKLQNTRLGGGGGMDGGPGGPGSPPGGTGIVGGVVGAKLSETLTHIVSQVKPLNTVVGNHNMSSSQLRPKSTRALHTNNFASMDDDESTVAESIIIAMKTKDGSDNRIAARSPDSNSSFDGFSSQVKAFEQMTGFDDSGGDNHDDWDKYEQSLARDTSTKQSRDFSINMVPLDSSVAQFDFRMSPGAGKDEPVASKMVKTAEKNSSKDNNPDLEALQDVFGSSFVDFGFSPQAQESEKEKNDEKIRRSSSRKSRPRESSHGDKKSSSGSRSRSRSRSKSKSRSRSQSQKRRNQRSRKHDVAKTGNDYREGDNSHSRQDSSRPRSSRPSGSHRPSSSSRSKSRSRKPRPSGGSSNRVSSSQDISVPDGSGDRPRSIRNGLTRSTSMRKGPPPRSGSMHQQRTGSVGLRRDPLAAQSEHVPRAAVPGKGIPRRSNSMKTDVKTDRRSAMTRATSMRVRRKSPSADNAIAKEGHVRGSSGSSRPKSSRNL